MQIEVYDVTESTADGCVDSKEEVARIALDLGLKKQLALLKGDKESVFPYRKMTTEEERVYGAILTRHTRLDEYDDSVIPLRVMQVAAHVRESCSDKLPILEVWHPRTGSDPLLIGKTKDWGGDNYILARWGEVLEPFAVLRERVYKMLVEKAKAEGQRLVVELQNAIAAPESRVLKYLDGEVTSYVPSLYA